MSREIKFRAWDKIQNRIVDDVQNIYEDDVSGHFYGCFGAMLDSEYLVIMQYTGLHDSNGKEVYEGDVVKCSDRNGIEFYAIVLFGNPNCTYTWGFQLQHISGDRPNLDILLWIEMEETGAICEVIGNIYENPELLEKE